MINDIQIPIDIRALFRYQKTEKRLLFRANIVRLGQQELSNTTIATALGTTPKTVTKWLSRANAFGIIGLRDEPRCGAPKTVTPEIQSKVIYLATHPPYEAELAGFSNISLRLLSWLMMQRGWSASLSHETIRQILLKDRLQVHRVKYWKTPTDPNFLEKMNAIVQLYINPPSDKLIICVDEMPSIQALERIGPSVAMKSGKPRRREYEYKRHGTTNLFAAFNIADGHVFGNTSQKKKHPDFLDFMTKVDKHWGYQNMTIIVDNYKTHNHKVIQSWLEQQNGRIEFVFTPFHGSWLNQIEIWFGILRRYCLKHSSFSNLVELTQKLTHFIETWNCNFTHPFKWRFAGW